MPNWISVAVGDDLAAISRQETEKKKTSEDELS